MRTALGRAAVGRADLVRIIVDLPPAWAARSAALLGFEAPVSRDEVPAPSTAAPAEPTEPRLPDAAAPVPVSVSVPVPFWRLETMTFSDASGVPSLSDGLTEDDLGSSGCSLFATPPTPLLARWSRLWPVLRAQIQGSVHGRRPDVPALVRALCRGEIVRRIPRVMRRAWSGRASVWVDRSARLVPFWSDQMDVCRRLRMACGQNGLDVRRLDDRMQARTMARRGDMLAGFRADPMTPVLVLGDLGAHGSPVERAAWLGTARRLHHAGVRVAALVPSPLARLDPHVARAWAAVSWERGRRRGGVAIHDARYLQERAERLLRLAAPAALVQPGLLRALRLLLPAWQADAATEADAWSHPDVRAADATGLVLHPEAAQRWRRQFAAEVDADLKARVSAAIGRWHGALPKELLRAETLVWHALIPSNIAPPPGNLDDAIAFVRRLEQTAPRGEGDPGLGAELRRYGRALLESMPASVYDAVPSLKIVWAAAFQGVAGVLVPPGIDPSVLDAAVVHVSEPRFWAVRQVGSHLVLSPLRSGGAWPSHETRPGSPVAWLLAGQPHLWVGREGARTQLLLDLDGGLSLPLQPGQDVRLASDRSEVVVTSGWSREPWAVAAGRDRFGLWADAEIAGVVQRFRWIPPGRFRMGSPEGEAGRWDDEGPQHVVTWTAGRWLADTPVTQALWTAVMGENPSYFQSPDRPVEQVSWDDCKEFLGRVNALAPKRKLEARLPTEAEWEYACRAGTETATWLGDLEIRGENDAPLLDSIAWYSGNCVVDFELAEGWDTSGWPEKQYDHSKGGTHPVRRKAPNPFGLYDMLGNVFEWCEDATGSNRVLRGGSWISSARGVRAALRFANAPGLRGDDLGFRLARGQEPGQDAEPGARDASAPRGASKRRKAR